MSDQYFNRWLRLIAIFYFVAGLILSFQSEIFAMVDDDMPKNIYFQLVIEGQVVGEFTDVGGIGSETDVIEQTVIVNGVEVIRKIPGITGAEPSAPLQFHEAPVCCSFLVALYSVAHLSNPFIGSIYSGSSSF